MRPNVSAKLHNRQSPDFILSAFAYTENMIMHLLHQCGYDTGNFQTHYWQISLKRMAAEVKPQAVQPNPPISHIWLQ